MTRITKTALLLAGVLSLAGCSGKPAPQALVGEWICKSLDGTHSFLDDIKYDSNGKFSATVISHQMILTGSYFVDGNKISYSGLQSLDPEKSRNLPISYQESPDHNTIKFGFVDPVSSEPKFAACRRNDGQR